MGCGQYCTEKCSRFNNGVHTPCLPGVGPKPARIMIVGESPGQKEDEQGVPFVGASGKLVNNFLADVGLDRTQIYITNAVKCGTPEENTAPTKKEIKICKQYLVDEIKEVKPEIIVTLGAKALEAVLNRTGIATINNNIFVSEEFNVKVLPVYHPAFGLRNPGVIPAIKKGFEMLADEVRGKEQVVDATELFIAKNENDINKILRKLEKVDKFAFDFETSHLNYLACKILSIAFTWNKGSAAVIPWELHTKDTLLRLSKILASDTIVKIAHNVKFEMNVCRANGIDLHYPIEDTMLMHHLLDENSKHGLDTLVLRYTKMGEYWKGLDEYKETYCKEHSITKDEFTYDKFPLAILCPYNGKDADATFRSFLVLQPRLVSQKLSKVYYEYVLPFTKIISEMEYRGILVDREKLSSLITEYTQKKVDLEALVYKDEEVIKYEVWRKEEAKEALKDKFFSSKILQSRYGDFDAYAESAIKEKDYKFNMSSPKQLGELFFTIPKRHPIKTTDKGGISVDEEVLEELDKLGINVAKTMLGYRRLLKYLSTYLISTYDKSAGDGRVHGEFLQHGTVTGRLSSRNPNLQNLPRDAKDFKKCLIADPGYTFVKADLAQAEFRCWAIYSNDEDMISDIHSGLDIHKRTASEVFGVPVSEIKKDDPRRTAAKNCVSGDTWIPTNNGLVQIKDIKVGDVVLDHLNREQTVLETITKEDDVYLVETGCGQVKCTKDHPFYTIDAGGNFVPFPSIEFTRGEYILSCGGTDNKKIKTKDGRPCVINDTIALLYSKNIYSVEIKNISKIGYGPVYDFVTTGDKIMVCNNLISLDCVFGLMYGRGSAAISAQYDISYEQAEEVKSAFFSRYPKAKDWLDYQKRAVRAHGYVVSKLGRYRRLPEINSDDTGVIAEATRQATNSPIQSLASDCNNHYMNITIKRARESGLDCFPLASVHDANFILVKDEQVSDLISIMKDVVKVEFPDFKCRMALDIEVGKNFGEFEAVK